MSSILDVYNNFYIGCYLGTLSLVGRNKKEIFVSLKSRLWKKIQNWRKSNFSKTSKEVLLKAIVPALPTYVMSVFLLLVTLADELEKMICFWWGFKRSRGRDPHWFFVE
ncbi:hypothetical protein PTKIN_Ptkin16aG0073700 [Pterospermum kingtungense]